MRDGEKGGWGGGEGDYIPIATLSPQKCTGLWCLPLAWRSTDRMFIPSKEPRFDLTSPRIDKMVSCVVTDSCSESEDTLFLATAVVVSLEFTQQSQTKEQKTHSN